MKYIIRLNGTVLVGTQWSPLAQAAWHRATRDQHAGGVVELLKDGCSIAKHTIVGGRGAAWPEGDACGLREVVKAIFQLLRDDNWDAKSIAEAMSSFGLPTTRSRADALRGGAGHPVELCPAEIVTLLYAVLAAYKGETQDEDTE